MKVYSLRAEPGDPRYLQATQGNYAFWQRGYEVVPFVRDDLQAGRLDADLTTAIESTLVWGSVAVVREAVERAGRMPPPNIDFPPELSAYVGREIREATMADVRRWVNAEAKTLPVHVKPRDRQKLFAGKVVSAFRDLIPLSGVDDDEPVVVQEVLKFRSEWRAYVLRRRALNVSHYKGDGIVFPDAAVISRAISDFASSPIGYGMDWAVTQDGRTVLVEVNDGFALGNYGMSGNQYTALVECRWREMMGLEDNGVGFEF
jgi:hypothetical protein